MTAFFGTSRFPAASGNCAGNGNRADDAAWSGAGNASYNCVVVLGPTAVGKTALAVALADHFGGEIISADSRQVYRGLDLGSGKDLADYHLPADPARGKPERTIPYHLIDVADVSEEYSVFRWQKAVYRVFPEILARGALPVVCGGTGMYLDAFVRGYELLPVPLNVRLRTELVGKSNEELAEILSQLKGGALHNTTDTLERHLLLRAIEIEVYTKEAGTTGDAGEPQDLEMIPRPDIRPLIIGTTFPRPLLREGIARRMTSRFEDGMIEEVVRLHAAGASFERLERLGLEYRFLSEYLEGKIATREELEQKLRTAIGQFAKRQETWFRRMEKMGVEIHWIPCDGSEGQRSVAWRFDRARELMERNGLA